MAPPSTLGERIGIARRRLGLTQKSLAHQVGLAAHTLSQIERGAHRELQSGSIRRLARVLGVTTDFLIGMDLPEEDIVELQRHSRDAEPGSDAIPAVS
jgi:transcriptional regulator with XRE-family HTH domain